jgi:hypothetical protein
MIDTAQKERLFSFGRALIDQERARVIVPPVRPASGFWFGGGNLVAGQDRTLYLAGRYRAYGDSRTGLGVGERGFELAIFESRDRGGTFTKVLSFSKRDLSPAGRRVLSIEGSALRLTGDGATLFVSSEKAGVEYPGELRGFRKPGTGVWTIDCMEADSIQGLREAEVRPLLQSSDPRFLHVKDPFLCVRTNGDLILGFCTHPYNWTSSNSAYMVIRGRGETFGLPIYDYFRRGFTWDVAISRITCFLRVPRVGRFRETDPIVLAFYDGGESMRNLDEHAQAVQRPRGYSCEEIGGLAWAREGDLSTIERLSVNLPAFVSPLGTGCSRYVDVLETEEGFYATWQQSQPDLSQPLVMNFLRREEAEEILGGQVRV